MNIQDAYPTDCIHEMYKHIVIDTTNHIVKCSRCSQIYKCLHNKGYEIYNNGYLQNGQTRHCKICKTFISIK